MTPNPVPAPNPQWRVTVRRWLFWGAIGMGLLISLFVAVLVRPPAPSGQPLSVPEAKGPVEVYLELLQSYVSIRHICFDPDTHFAGRDRLVEAQKRMLRALDLGGAPDRQRQALATLADVLVSSWNELASRLRRPGVEPSKGELERCLAPARAALREAAQRLSLSRLDLEAARYGQQPAGGGADGAADPRPSGLAELVQTFEEIVAAPAAGPAARPPLATDSDGGRDEPSRKKS